MPGHNQGTDTLAGGSERLGEEGAHDLAGPVLVVRVRGGSGWPGASGPGQGTGRPGKSAPNQAGGQLGELLLGPAPLGLWRFYSPPPSADPDRGEKEYAKGDGILDVGYQPEPAVMTHDSH